MPPDPDATQRLNVPTQQGGFQVPPGSAGQQPGNWQPPAPSSLMAPAPADRNPDPYGLQGVTQAQWDQMSATLGYDAKAAYIAYAESAASTNSMNWAQGTQNNAQAGGGLAQWAEDPTSWIATQEKAIYGQYAPIVEARAQLWAANNNEAMPTDLWNLEIAALKSAPATVTDSLMQSVLDLQAKPPDVNAYSPAIKAKIISNVTGNALLMPSDPGVVNFSAAWYIQQYGQDAFDAAVAKADPIYAKWLTAHQKAGQALAGGSSSTALGAPASTSGGILGTIEQNYLVEHPVGVDTQQAADTRLTNSFAVLGRPPTAAEYKQLQNASAEQITAYIDSQPAAGTGMTYGTYSTLFDANQKQWQQYFGHDPTPTELRSIAGMTPDEVTAYIMNSPSKSVQGATIGEASDYVKMWDSTQKALGGSNVSDWMLSQIHAAAKKPAGPMAPNGVNAAPAASTP